MLKFEEKLAERRAASKKQKLGSTVLSKKSMVKILF